MKLMKRVREPIAQWISDPHERRYAAALALIVGIGTWLRAGGLSTGTLFRDDAWVALTAHFPLGTAAKMVGTAPGFVLLERSWIQLTEPHLWLMQLPTFCVSVLGMILVAAVVRFLGLPRTASLFAVALVAFSRIDITYATHLKPYAHDIVAASLLLAAAHWFRRGGHAGWFAGIATISLVTSFSILPLVIGLSVWIGVIALRTQRTSALLAPGAAAIAVVSVVAYFVRNGISPRLDTSWQASYLDTHSLGAFLSSFWSITTSLLWGLGDTAPGLHIPYLGRLIQFAMLFLIVLSLRRWRQSSIAWAGIFGAYAAALVHLAPLGTGRTDAYLHPALAIVLVIGGLELCAIARSYDPQRAIFTVACFALVVSLTGVDRLLHREPYAGGNFQAVLQEATDTLQHGGTVLVEGSARWPWAFYGAHQLSLKFSDQYNTGFAPVSKDSHVVLMPGSIIEGGYNANATIQRLNEAPYVLYIQSDDWPSMGYPLHAAALGSCYKPAAKGFIHIPGYYIQHWTRYCTYRPGLDFDRQP